jgi:hypothetical protein
MRNSRFNPIKVFRRTGYTFFFHGGVVLLFYGPTYCVVGLLE